MSSVKDVIEELRFVSDRISTQVRTISVSLIIVTWGLLLGTSQTSLPATDCFRKKLLTVGVVAVVAIICDYFQYLFGYWGTKNVLKQAESSKAEVAEYDYTDWRYRFRETFFWIKQIVLMAAILWFLITIVPYLAG